MLTKLPVSLTLVGDGPALNQVLDMTRQTNVTEMITFTGSVSLSSIPTIMQEHHVLVFPTDHEGMPNVVLEAQTNGCVVIVTRLPGVTDVAIEDGVTGSLVEPGDIHGFADKVEALLDPAVWNSDSQAAIERSHRLFSVETMGAGYEAVIQDLHAGKYPLSRPFNQSHSLRDVPFHWRDYLPGNVRSRLGALSRILGGRPHRRP